MEPEMTLYLHQPPHYNNVGFYWKDKQVKRKLTPTDLAFSKSSDPVLELFRQILVKQDTEANRNLIAKPVINHNYLHALGIE